MNPWLRSFILFLITSAAKAQSYSPPYESDGPCRNRTYEYRVRNYCCSKCRPGTRKVSDCTGEKDTVCEVCPAGMYSGMNYYPNCFTCSKCPEDKGMEYAKPCTRDSDAVCVCKSGWYCVLNDDPCTMCERHTMCSPGKGAEKPGTATENVKCRRCLSGTFSNETSSEMCQPHTRCDLQGRTVQHPGNDMADTVCGPIITMNRNLTTPQPPITTRSASSPTELSTEPNVRLDLHSSQSISSVFTTQPPDDVFFGLWIGLPIITLLVVLLITAFSIRHRKALLKPTFPDAAEARPCKSSAHLCSPTENHVLLADSSSSSDPSTSLSSDSHSQGTGVSQEFLHVEQPNVSSPVVNLSFTATINCQVNPATGCCSIPISPCVQPPEPEFPLSQEEELCVSCEQEDSKDAIQSVQESGMTKY
ncbi:tumor necrosis factor receptor superfamily member 1B [Tachysurus fulvidraco]|uniref:tumor necrosis factor receptor superfamily member 1B n=1 Tax=Tachysurus fulvidraco TaxID=1234273 RepID=UPI000F50F246|nr:tumor necrosis factor receptor superfamily member 1B [Tachysurus fulvidraco]UWT60555.1 tumor necrosis factor receptor 2 [Tachysurus fulvidraco]